MDRGQIANTSAVGVSSDTRRGSWEESELDGRLGRNSSSRQGESFIGRKLDCSFLGEMTK